MNELGVHRSLFLDLLFFLSDDHSDMPWDYDKARKVVGSLLAAFREQSDRTSLSDLVEKVLGRRDDAAFWDGFGKHVVRPEDLVEDEKQTKTNVNRRLRSLEGGTLRNLPEECLPHLAELYGISPLMLIPILYGKSIAQRNHVLARLPLPAGQPVHPDHDKVKVSQVGIPDGTHDFQLKNESVYQFSEERLDESDCIISHVTLARASDPLDEENAPRDNCRPKQGESDKHWHPGDELLLVLDGAIDLVLEDNGIVIQRLRKWDYAHFRAEQSHHVRNRSSNAEAHILILRLNQIQGGYRRKIAKDLATFVGLLKNASKANLSSKDTANLQGLLDNGLMSWLHGRNQQYLSGHSLGDGFIRDFSGLGGFLRRNGLTNGRCNPTAIGTAIDAHLKDKTCIVTDKKRKVLTTVKNRAARLFSGEIEPGANKEHLHVLADCTGIPRFLFYQFLFPRIPHLVVLRSHPRTINGGNPFNDISNPANPVNFENYELKENAGNYYIPHRTLSGSDVATSYLWLNDGKSCPKNTHPGYEFILCLHGKVKIEFDGGENKKELLPFDCILFRGEQPHVVSAGEDGAFLFVVRIYGIVGKPYVKPRQKKPKKR